MKKVIICLLVLFSMDSTSFADDISLTADLWAPYTMDPESGKDGYLIDLARAAFKLKGHNVIYKVRPYSRGIKDTKNGTFDGVVGIYRQDAVDNGFNIPKNELGVSINTFFIRKDDTWKYDSKLKAKSLAGKKIGVIQDYVFAEIEDYLQANKHTTSVQYMTGDTPLNQNLKKLLLKRFDITIDDRIVVHYTAKKMGIETKIKEAGNLAAQNHIVIGFSSKNPKSSEYAMILSKGIDALRNSGELDKILAKYYIRDWKRK